MAWLEYDNALLAPLQITTETDKQRVSKICESVQSFIERFCHRCFDFREHDETCIIGQDGSIVLRNQPVETITRVCMYNQGWLTIQNTAAQITNWTTTDEAIMLMSISSGVKTYTELKYHDYPTLASLGTAINHIAGWETTVQPTYALYPSSDIEAQQWGSAQQLCTVAIWQDFVGQFDFRPNGIIYGLIPFGLASGYQTPTALAFAMFRDFKMRIVYQAGFKEIPTDILSVAANLVTFGFNGSKEIMTEEIQGWSYTYFTPDKMTMSDKRVLSQYRERII